MKRTLLILLATLLIVFLAACVNEFPYVAPDNNDLDNDANDFELQLQAEIPDVVEPSFNEDEDIERYFVESSAIEEVDREHFLALSDSLRGLREVNADRIIVTRDSYNMFFNSLGAHWTPLLEEILVPEALYLDALSHYIEGLETYNGSIGMLIDVLFRITRSLLLDAYEVINFEGAELLISAFSHHIDIRQMIIETHEYSIEMLTDLEADDFLIERFHDVITKEQRLIEKFEHLILVAEDINELLSRLPT